MVYTRVKEISVQLVYGQKVVVKNQTVLCRWAIGTPQGPVVFSTVFAVIAGTDSMLILESKTLQENLGIDAMVSVKGKA